MHVECLCNTLAVLRAFSSCVKQECNTSMYADGDTIHTSTVD